MPDLLTTGSSGEDVKNLQGLLNFHLSGTGAPRLVRDGTFGSKTKAAVLRFQILNHLSADGVVGPKTRAVLLDVRQASMLVAAAPASRNGAPPSSAGLQSLLTKARTKSGVSIPPGFGVTPVAGGNVSQPVPPPTVNAQSVVIQVGQQANFNPWFISPFVISGQWNIVIQNNGRAPFVISPGLQFFQNQVGSPSGRWTGQGFVQMGPSGLLKPGNFDLLNPFVQVFLQKNDGQPPSTGFAIGNQANWNLVGDKLSLFVNVQEVFAVDTSTGLGIAPSTQVLAGVGVDLFQLFKSK